MQLGNTGEHLDNIHANTVEDSRAIQQRIGVLHNGMAGSTCAAVLKQQAPRSSRNAGSRFASRQRADGLIANPSVGRFVRASWPHLRGWLSASRNRFAFNDNLFSISATSKPTTTTSSQGFHVLFQFHVQRSAGLILHTWSIDHACLLATHLPALF